MNTSSITIPKRIKVKLKGLTPIEYRNQAIQAV
ncbi:TPA: IS3 family transposase [Photobacterium damselae]